jgi:chemotaxis protein methyltransferase CheR
MKEINLNNTELRSILTEIENLTGVKLSFYAFGFIKRRTELFMQKNQITSEKEFIYRLHTSNFLAELFKNELYISTSELFRDAEMWNYLADSILTGYRQDQEIKIALPHCTGPEELYSLISTLDKHEKKLTVSIYVSLVSETLKEVMENGQFTEKEFTASVKNIDILNFVRNPEDIFKKKEQHRIVKHHWTGKINYDTKGIFDYPYIDEFDLIICRNQLIYYTKEAQSKAYKMLTKALKKGKWLILGEKERPDESNSSYYKQVYKTLSIYKRKSYT